MSASILPSSGGGTCESFQQPQPASRAGFRRLVEPQLQIDIDQPSGMLGALQVAAHPIQTVRDPGEHGGFAVMVPVHRRDPSCAQHPGIFAAAALRRVHYQRSAPQRHARQPARHQRHVLAIQNVRAQIDVPRLRFAIEEARRPRKTQRRLRDIVPRLGLDSSAGTLPVAPLVLCGPINMP